MYTLGGDLHLDEKGLELATSRICIPNVRPGHESRDVGDGIAKRSIEHKPVDRFVEGF